MNRVSRKDNRGEQKRGGYQVCRQNMPIPLSGKKEKQCKKCECHKDGGGGCFSVSTCPHAGIPQITTPMVITAPAPPTTIPPARHRQVAATPPWPLLPPFPLPRPPRRLPEPDEEECVRYMPPCAGGVAYPPIIAGTPLAPARYMAPAAPPPITAAPPPIMGMGGGAIMPYAAGGAATYAPGAPYDAVRYAGITDATMELMGLLLVRCNPPPLLVAGGGGGMGVRDAERGMPLPYHAAPMRAPPSADTARPYIARGKCAAGSSGCCVGGMGPTTPPPLLVPYKVRCAAHTLSCR